MLNNELLLFSTENVGIVTVTLEWREPLFGTTRVYMYEFNGLDKPEGKVYAEFTKEDTTPKTVSIPINTVIALRTTIGYAWFDMGYEGFELIDNSGTAGNYALKLVNKTAKVALAGYYG